VIDADAFASLLCDWCVPVEPGDQVLIRAPTLAEPLVLALHRALLDREAWPLPRLTVDDLSEDFYRWARERHLDSFAPLELVETEAAAAVIGVQAPSNTRALAGVDPALVTRATRARAPVQEARLARKWCGTIWPTAALAQQAMISERDYASFLERALFLDQPDPASAWHELSERQHTLVRLLEDVDEIRIEAEGTDVRVRVGGRTWINSDGKHNMPSGEIFTGPVEDSAEGTIRFTIPSSPRGVEVGGVELTFAQGEVVRARAARNQPYLDAALAADRGARLVGELGIGTNPGIDRPTGTILLDEKIAGTVHLALGRSYPETGGRNSSAIHWDMICDLREGGRLIGDGQMLNDKLWPFL
jgi:aminopeptidase